MRELPPQDYLLKVLRYEPETGKLYWLPRCSDMFRPGNIGSDANCRSWNRLHAGREALATLTNGYLTGPVGGQTSRAHRVIWKMMTGKDPQIIDHINGDPLDNRWTNLRSTTHALNHRNCKRHGRNTSGMSGVSWASHANLWRVLISLGGRRRHVGYYRDFADACAARLEAKRVHGFSERHGV